MLQAEKLPLGIQDFTSLRLENNVYIDKTQDIYRLIQASKYCFLSRPRRFGKSLLISTLQALFEGRKDLFAGLWIEDNHDFQAHPVIRLDLSLLDFEQFSLGQALLHSFRQTAKQYNLVLQSESAKTAFEELIVELSKIKSVVVLIDEYDKPITDYLLSDHKAKLEQHQAELRNVYGVLKALNAHLRFVLLTGVSKIGKLSLFSDLNNLLDISLDPEFASILGYSQAEIETAFPLRLQQAGVRLTLDTTTLWQHLKQWYNGYSWDGVQRLYCPFSFLLFLQNPVFKSYWYQTGTPTFLVHLIKDQKINPLDFEQVFVGENTLTTFDLDALDPVAVMFQTGYLTIDQIDAGLDGVAYRLSYPNREVREGFSRHLLEHYSQQTSSGLDAITIWLRKSLEAQDWPGFFERLQKVYTSIPYFIVPEREKHFHAIFHALLYASGLVVDWEKSTSQGRIDTVVETRGFVAIFELKVVGTAQAAIAQIKAKAYGEQFSKPVLSIGMVFDLETKNIKDWAIAAQ
jgi:hypothetical protein